MPLNLQAQSQDGDYMPYISYNAKAGRWYIKVEGVNGDIEVQNPVLAFDFANIKTGWLFYTAGMGPEKVWDPAPGVLAPKPSGPRNFKRGFEVIVHGPGQIGMREFSSTAGVTISPILEMYAVYEAGAASNHGKVPIFACAGVKAIQGKQGTNYSPTFKLQSWVDRGKLPFDGNGHHAPHQQYAMQPEGNWTLDQAVVECAKLSITKDQLIAHLKSLGNAGYNRERDTPAVRSMIAKASAETDEGFGESPGSDDDIPFAWLAPLILPLTLAVGLVS